MRFGGCQRTGLATNFIVVSQRPQFHTIGFGTGRQVFGGQGAIRDNGVAMQVGVQYVGHASILGARMEVIRTGETYPFGVAGMGKAQFGGMQ